MQQAEKKILNKLLDTYENSKLSRGENKVAVHISYAFTKKSLPEYFDESSIVYEEIHAIAKQLQTKGFITIVWKNNREDHIIEKVVLCEEAIPEVYQYVHRVSREAMEKAALQALRDLLETKMNSVTESFVSRMTERIRNGKSVKEYMDISDVKSVGDLVKALNAVICNEEECFIREFSISHFHDSKVFHTLSAKICKIIREEIQEYEFFEDEELLAEYQIYHTPSYVYLKGNACLKTGVQVVDISEFPEGLGFAVNKQNLPDMMITASKPVESVVTIENLTTFFRFQRENSLIIYLGGYHNHIRRMLLQKIYEAFNNARYYHFGDIDAGGFQIFYHLKEKTRIPFELYKMDLHTLKSYEKYGKKLTENDRKRLKKLMSTKMGESEKECAEYMLAHNVKLEQECIIE